VSDLLLSEVITISHLTFCLIYLQRELDNLNLFNTPVYVDYPDIADEYLSRVKEPMDFTTIEEQRLPEYHHMCELQDDLILTFRNCCFFNEETSEFYEHAM
jgi:hypothetical protein